MFAELPECKDAGEGFGALFAMMFVHRTGFREGDTKVFPCADPGDGCVHEGVEK